MRAFTSLIIPASFILYAQAAVVEKREISAPVELCVTDMTSAIAQVDIFNAAVQNFNRTQGYPGAFVEVRPKGLELEKRIKQAGVSCCVTPPNTFTTEETDTILATVGTFTPKLVDTLNSLIVKEPEFNALPLVSILYADDFKKLRNQTSVVNTCIVAKLPSSPPSYLQTINGHIAQLDTRFTAAISAFTH